MKMNKKLIALFLIISVLVLSMTLFACNKAENDPGENKVVYQIPDGLTINVAIYNNDMLLGTIINGTFTNVEQHKITMNTTNSFGTESSVVYIGYKVSDLISSLGITLPEITGVWAYASDNYLIQAENIENAYITIGMEEDGVFVVDNKGPRYISDSNSAVSSTINQFIAKIVFNYVKPAEEPNGNNGENTGGDTPVVVEDVVVKLNVDMTQGTKTNTITVPFAIMADDVTNVTYDNKGTIYYGFTLHNILRSMGKQKQDGTTMTFINNYESVGFVCSDDDEAGDYSARVFTKAEIESTENYIKIVRDGDATRCFSDLGEPTEGATTYRHKLKHITKIVVYGTDAATLELTWKAVAPLTVDMTQGTKTNTITVPFTTVAPNVTNIIYDNKGTKLYGFTLSAILRSMGKQKQDGTTMTFINNYESVGFVCSDDEEAGDYSARVFTKSEIESAENYIYIVKDGNTSRCFSDLGEPSEGATTYRHKLKNITSIVVYGTDAATLELTWPEV